MKTSFRNKIPSLTVLKMIFELNQPSSNGKTKNYEINVPVQKGIQKSNDRRISIVVNFSKI